MTVSPTARLVFVEWQNVGDPRQGHECARPRRVRRLRHQVAGRMTAHMMSVCRLTVALSTW